MKRDPDQCRYCGRRSERIALGLSCFHCGRTPDRIRMNPVWLVLSIVVSAAIGAAVARMLS